MSKPINCNKYTIMDDHIEFSIHSDTYGDFVILIDKEDYEKVNKYNWGIVKAKNTERLYYVQSNVAGRLHRLIMNAPKDTLVDHKNGDTCDNRKNNLRICTRYENAKNRRRSEINKSGHKGVCLINYYGTYKWCAYASHKNKTVRLGIYDDIIDAINAREEYEAQYYKEFNREDIDFDLIAQNLKAI